MRTGFDIHPAIRTGAGIKRQTPLAQRARGEFPVPDLPPGPRQPTSRRQAKNPGVGERPMPALSQPIVRSVSGDIGGPPAPITPVRPAGESPASGRT